MKNMRRKREGLISGYRSRGQGAKVGVIGGRNFFCVRKDFPRGEQKIDG